jgi:hypothetical protein
MDNINNEKKPQNKKFSLFCCFCANDERRKRKVKLFNQPNISVTGNKTSITLHSDVNVRHLPDDNSKNKNSINKPVIDHAKKCSSFVQDENNKINDSFNKQNNNLMKFNTINNLVHNISIQDINEKIKLHNSKNNDKSNIKENNGQYILNSNDLVENNLIENKEVDNNPKESNEIIVDNQEPINIQSNNNNCNNIINESVNSNVIENNNEIRKTKNSMSNEDIIGNKSKVDNQENEDNVNIYGDNNSSINKVKENVFVNSNKDLVLSKKPNMAFKYRNDYSSDNSKNKTDSIIINNNDDNDFGINGNIEKLNKNSSTSFPYNKFKLNLSNIKKKENNYTSINTKPTNFVKKTNTINNSDIITNFPNVSKKSQNKYSHSLKLIKTIKMEGENKIKLFRNKTGKFAISNFENNFKFKFDYQKPKNEDEEEEKEKEDNIDKEKTIIFSNNKITDQNFNNGLPLSNLENELNYISTGNYFNLNSKKEMIVTEDEENQNLTTTQHKNQSLQNNNEILGINNNNINNNPINEEENKKANEIEDHIKDFEGEIEDEKDDLDEENKHINDSKSIISNYVVAPLVGIQDFQSYAPSLYSKSEFKDNISNINDLTSNKYGGFSIPPEFDAEIEILNENGKEFKSFIETPRASGTYNKRFTHKNINYNSSNENYIRNPSSTNKSWSIQLKNISDKIKNYDKDILKYKETINKIDDKMKIYEDYNKKYQLWIEKEEMETEVLINFINFLNSSK